MTPVPGARAAGTSEVQAPSTLILTTAGRQKRREDVSYIGIIFIPRFIEIIQFFQHQLDNTIVLSL
jgi:hypothetical protein